MIFETHAHYDSTQFDTDRENLLLSMEGNGVGHIVNVGASLAGCRASIQLAQDYDFIYAGVGVHPDEVGSLNEDTFGWLEQQLSHPKVVAVGEIGLDYYWDKEDRELQKEWFIRQLDLARAHQLPVLIHSRDAAADTMEIMRAHAQKMSGVIHCFSYSLEQALEYIKMGFYIGIGGVVTFKNAKKLKQIVAAIPIESIVLETDCPYMAPEPHRGERNDSSYLRFVAQTIADYKGLSFEEVVRITEENARKMYQM